MGKYPISKEFFPFSMFAPPVRNAKMASFMGAFLRVPGWLWRDKTLSVQKKCIPGYDGALIDILIIEPTKICGEAPCLIYYHGGGFLFPAAGYHYKLAVKYAKETSCKVLLVQYRLTPKYFFPIPVEDCYAALCWTIDHTNEIGVDKERIAVGGDSAGGALAAAVAQMARDRMEFRLCFQLLVYPVTDRRMNSESNRRFTDTPMWNSKLSEKMWDAYLTDESTTDIAYASPLEARSFTKLPPTYIETAEFDCLRDEGLAYAEALCAADVPVEVYETKGTVHGFDIVEKAPTTQRAIKARIQYMKKHFA